MPARVSAPADVAHPLQAKRKRMRVKSRQPPNLQEAQKTEWFVAALGVASVAAMQLPGTADAFAWLSDTLGGPGIASAFLVLVVPNLLVYYPLSFYYMYLDLYCHDQPWLQAKKIQPTSPRPTAKDYWRIAGLTAFNTFVVEPLLVAFMYFVVWPNTGHCAWTEDACRSALPNFWYGALVCIPVMVLVEETGFYWTHRAAHWGPLYRAIHKVHHSFTAPAAMGAKYAHPVEHAVSNVGPLMLGPALLGAHPFFYCAWFCAGILQTCTVHSSYHLLWFLPHPSQHDWHHEKHDESFSTEFSFWDWACGTDAAFRARRAGELDVFVVGVDKEEPRARSHRRRASSPADGSGSEGAASPRPRRSGGSPSSDPADWEEDSPAAQLRAR